MRKLLEIFAVVALFGSGIAAVPAQAVTIDFEAGTTQGQLIQGEYEGSGVTFSGATILKAPDYNFDAFPAHSGTTVVYNGDGDIRLFFSAFTFDLSAYATTSTPLILTVFGLDGVQLGSSILAPNLGTTALISYQGQGIASALFSTGEVGNFTLDDISFGGSTVSAAPEPATWAMMILGFGLAGVAIRRGRKGARVSYAT